jgi:hypothetical protein
MIPLTALLAGSLAQGKRRKTKGESDNGDVLKGVREVGDESGMSIEKA